MYAVAQKSLSRKWDKSSQAVDIYGIAKKYENPLA